MKKDLGVFKVANSTADAFTKAAQALAGEKPFSLNLKTAWDDAVKSSSFMSKQGSAFHDLANLKRVSGYAGSVLGLLSLPSQIATTVTDVSHALKQGTFGKQGDKSVDDIVKTTKTTLEVTRGATEFTRDFTQYNQVHKAIKAALNVTEAGRSTEELAKPLSKIANKIAFDTLVHGKDVLKHADKIAEKVAMSALDHGVAKKVIATVGEDALKTAAELAAKTGAETAAKVGAKFAGRLVPGVNIAIAVMDSAHAVETLRNPNASMGKKLTAGITALGSIAAATNIPIVSQVGAVVSGASSIVESFFFRH